MMIGADPRAVETDLRGDTGSYAVHDPDVLDYINRSFARFRLRDGMLGVVGFHIEVHSAGATGSLSGRNRGGILSVD
jgi:hypothetical protein